MKHLIWVPFVVAFCDQWIKQRMRALPLGEVFFCIPGFVELAPCVNTGAAFSILSGNNAVLIVFSVLILLFSASYILKSMKLTTSAMTACMVLLGGACGNLIDRIFFGGVTDYIRILFVDFPVFNLADIAITGSVILLITLLMTNRLEDNAGETHGR